MAETKSEAEALGGRYFVPADLLSTTSQLENNAINLLRIGRYEETENCIENSRASFWTGKKTQLESAQRCPVS
jgi:hypothetical protein